MHKKFLFSGLVLLILLTACKGGLVKVGLTSTPDLTFTPADLTWLKAHTIPFETSDPTQPLQDLDFLKGMVGNARIVALGDATDGTHEFFQMKQRMLEYLVEKMGFTALMMPFDYLQADRINAYIQTGEGNAAELLKGFATLFDVQEILDTIEWMRRYDADPAHARKISFYGFATPSDEAARQAVTQFIQKVNPPAAAQIEDDYSCWLLNDTCMKKIQDGFDLLKARQTDYTAKSSPADFEMALHGARIVIQNVMISSKSNNYDYFSQYIENLQWTLAQAGPEGKVVLWAHNSDVSMFSAGDSLRQQYGDDLVIFGILFYQGSFNAIRFASYPSTMQVFHAPEPTGDSYDFFLQATGLPGFFLDMRSARPDSPDQAWLFNPHSSYVAGATYDLNNPPTFNEPLAKMYDVVIYFKETTPSELLNP